MTKTLEEQIEERKHQAAEKKTFLKALLVAQKLGKPDSLGNVFNDAATSFTVRNVHREVDVRDEYGSWTYPADSVTVSSGGKKVFEAFGQDARSVCTYLPGAWEKELDGLQTAVRHATEKQQVEKTRREAERKQAAENEKRRRWGL